MLGKKSAHRQRINPPCDAPMDRPENCLRQVITERSEDHSVESFGCDSGLSLPCRSNPRPGLASHVGILRAPLKPALGAGIDAVPEARRALDERPRVGRAIGKTARKKSATDARRGFGVAAGVAEEGRAIAHILAGDGIEIRRTAGVLGTSVEVEINLGPVPLQRRESLIALDQIEGSVGMDRRIGKTAGPVAPDSTSAKGVQPEVEVLVDELPSCIGADAAPVLR